MTGPTLLSIAGYSIALVGVLLLVLKQGVSLLGIALVTVGYLLLLIAGFIQ